MPVNQAPEEVVDLEEVEEVEEDTEERLDMEALVSAKVRSHLSFSLFIYTQRTRRNSYAAGRPAPCVMRTNQKN